MKPFDDFLKTLTVDTYAAIADKANKSMELYRNTDESNGNNSAATQIGLMSFAITTEMLRLYHEWLAQELVD